MRSFFFGHNALISLDRRMAWAIGAIVVIEIWMGIVVNFMPPAAIRDALVPSPRPPIS